MARLLTEMKGSSTSSDLWPTDDDDMHDPSANAPQLIELLVQRCPDCRTPLPIAIYPYLDAEERHLLGWRCPGCDTSQIYSLHQTRREAEWGLLVHCLSVCVATSPDYDEQPSSFDGIENQDGWGVQHR